MQTALTPIRMRPRVAAQFLDMGLSTLWSRVKHDPDAPSGYLDGRVRYFDRTDLEAYAVVLKERGMAASLKANDEQPA
jgi:hypothetical protein